MWIVITQHSAFEVSYKTFETEYEASEYYDHWNDDVYHLLHIFIAEVKDKSGSGG